MIGVNLFIAVIPLLIVGYAIIEAFNPNRSIGTVFVGRFHLSGDTARIVRDTFTNAKGGKNVALSISLISLLITGIDVAATVGTAYARAFQVSPPRGVQKYLRGGAWLLTLLAMTSVGLTVRYWASSRPWWFLALVLPISFGVTFCFYLATPRLVLNLPFAWHDLLPGALICAIVGWSSQRCLDLLPSQLVRSLRSRLRPLRRLARAPVVDRDRLRVLGLDRRSPRRVLGTTCRHRGIARHRTRIRRARRTGRRRTLNESRTRS